MLLSMQRSHQLELYELPGISRIILNQPMYIQPLGNKVLIALTEESKQTESGIVLPSAADNNRQWAKGQARAVGPDAKAIKPNDHVLFLKPWDGLQIQDLGQKFYVLEEKEILAVTNPQ